MAAVYSEDFFGTPEARLYYHTQITGSDPVVQEMIWTPSNDTWVSGHQFTDPWPKSDLTATIDAATKTLRLFYSAGNLTLQESWLNMSLAGATWQSGMSCSNGMTARTVLKCRLIGIKIPNLLAHNDASIAAISTSTSTLLYYYSIVAQEALCIREITISGVPGSATDPESFTDPFSHPPLAPIVAQPALILDYQIAIYQPIGAVVSTADPTSESIQVFWTENNVDIGSGYGAIKTTQRNVTGAWAASSYGAGEGQVEIPLGDSNSAEPA